jgi:hypothetical protein
MWVVAPVWLRALAPPALAEIDPQTKKPYDIHVVLRVADNRFLTPLFQEQLRRELADQLRLSFGALARVQVASEHPLLRDIEARGLEQVLEGWDEVSDRQTYFVLLDYAAGQYQLRARGHDGLTGQATPLVRRLQTTDRAIVARMAAGLVEQDFSPVGVATAAGKDARLTFRGGALGVSLDRWVRQGDVFAVSRIVPEGARRRATRVAWALLEVLEPPHDGTCRCRYWHRFQEDRLGNVPGVLGFRARKLPTETAAARVRLIDDETLQPLDGVRVEFIRPGSDTHSDAATGRDGLAVSPDPFARFALARIVSGGEVRAQLPVAVTAGPAAVCRIKLRPESEARASAEYRREAWLRRIFENARVAVERTAELNRRLGQSLQAALDDGRTGLKNLDAELTYLGRERDELHRLARDLNIPMKRFDLRDGDQELVKLRQQRDELQQFVGRVETVLKETNNQEALGLHKLLEQARLFEGEARYDQAIRLYERVLQASPDQPKVKANVDALKQAWAVKDKKHAEARAFIYETWPKVDADGLLKELAKAKAALQTSRAAGDRLTPRKLQQADVLHAANLKKQLDVLRRQNTEDSRNRTRAVQQAADGLRSLHADVLAFLADGKKE